MARHIRVLAAAMLWFAVAPGRGEAHLPIPSGLAALLRDARVWRAGFLFGSQSISYFTSSTWIPFLVASRGPSYLALVFSALSIALIIPSLLLVAVHWSYPTSRLYYMLAGVLMTIGGFGLAQGLVDLAWVFAFLLGLGSSMTFLGAMATPSLLAHRDSEVVGFSALMLAVGYAISFVGSLLGGILVDRTHVLTAPFWVVALSGVVVLLLGATLPGRAENTQ